MRNFFAFLIAGVFIIGGSSCNIINPSEVVPTYVIIDSFTFVGNPSYGTSSHKITNVYVYFNSATVGVYDLPAKIPVIATASGKLTVIPGIDFDGMTGNEQIYPFYTADTMNLVPSPGHKISFPAKTGYRQIAVPLPYYETFEGGQGSYNSFKKVSGDTSLLNTTNPSEVFEGNGSGIIRLDAGKDSATVISVPPIYLTPGKEAYLEMDYMGTLSVAVGMSTILNTGGDIYSEYILGFKPRTTWGKVYISLTDFVGSHQGSEYHIMLHSQKQADLTDGYLLIDNIKVVSF